WGHFEDRSNSFPPGTVERFESDVPSILVGNEFVGQGKRALDVRQAAAQRDGVGVGVVRFHGRARKTPNCPSKYREKLLLRGGRLIKNVRQHGGDRSRR